MELELDDLRKIWLADDAVLETRLHLSAPRLLHAAVDRGRTALRRLAQWLAIEVAAGAGVALWLGSFLGDHTAEPRFAVPAIALMLANLAATIAAVRQLVALRALDYGRPVLEIQKRLDLLRLERLRAVQLALLAGPLLWTPLLIVALRALWGVDAYAVLPGTYLLANLLLGLAIIPIAVWLARRYAGRLEGSHRLRRLMHDLAGHNLKVATAALQDLARFEQE
jgi:hypothetical protein